MTLVTAIVPNYNYAQSLRLCLSALQAQTYQPLEILVVDDHSTDSSVQVADSLGVQVIRTPRNGGVAAARNVGAAHARGEVFFFVDSDVALAPDAIATAVALLQADSRIGAACGIYDPEPLIRHSLVEEYRCMQAHYWRLSSEGTVSFLFPSLCAMPRSVYDEVGPFNPRLAATEEVDYGERLSQRYQVRLSSAVRGRHDDDHALVSMLRKLFHRGRMRIPLYAARRRFAQGYETSSRAYGSLAALLSLGLLPLALVLGTAGLIPSALALAASLGFDMGMYRFVARRRGPLFLAYYTAVHFLVNVTISMGVGIGVLQWMSSRKFRRLYDVPAVA